MRHKAIEPLFGGNKDVSGPNLFFDRFHILGHEVHHLLAIEIAFDDLAQVRFGELSYVGRLRFQLLCHSYISCRDTNRVGIGAGVVVAHHHHHPVIEGHMNCVQCHDPHGRDINAQMCFFPDGKTFIAGEDTGQPDPLQGWGIFKLKGTKIGKLKAEIEQLRNQVVPNKPRCARNQNVPATQGSLR